MSPNGRGIRVGRKALIPTPAGLLSTSQWRGVNQPPRATPATRGAGEARRGREDLIHAMKRPIPTETALGRFGAYTETATASDAAANTDEPSADGGQ